MEATFIQKVMICIVISFLAAGLIHWYKIFVVDADEALNKGYKSRTTIQP